MKVCLKSLRTNKVSLDCLLTVLMHRKNGWKPHTRWKPHTGTLLFMSSIWTKKNRCGKECQKSFWNWQKRKNRTYIVRKVLMKQNQSGKWITFTCSTFQGKPRNANTIRVWRSPNSKEHYLTMFISCKRLVKSII